MPGDSNVRISNELRERLSDTIRTMDNKVEGWKIDPTTGDFNITAEEATAYKRLLADAQALKAEADRLEVEQTVKQRRLRVPPSRR